MADWVALIRAIGPVTHKKMSMADLRGAVSARGLDDVRTVLATGNLLFRSDAPGDTLGDALQALIEEVLIGFGLSLPGNSVVVMTRAELGKIMSESPFVTETTTRPARVLYVATARALDDAARQRAADWDLGPERLVPVSRGLFVDYVDGVGMSKLTPARLDKLIGQPGTGRNWNTLGKLLKSPTAQ